MRERGHRLYLTFAELYLMRGQVRGSANHSTGLRN
jgi:hypothetical protein